MLMVVHTRPVANHALDDINISATACPKVANALAGIEWSLIEVLRPNGGPYPICLLPAGLASLTEEADRFLLEMPIAY
jgi:hypothetical protein